MPTIDVSGATLYYDVFGSGPVLLYIPGAEGRGNGFFDVAELLSKDFTVVCMTRRGYSKSLLHGPQEFAKRLETDADDAAQLIKHISPGEPVIVFGNSSGAIVTQMLLVRHPDCLRKVLVHEPPCFSVMPDELSRVRALGLTSHVYNIYRANGTAAAMNVFLGALVHGEERSSMQQTMDTALGDEIRANVMFWFEFELKQYTSAAVDLDKLQQHKEKFVPAAGVLSGDGPGVGPIAVIAKFLGKDVLRLPGGHVGFVTDPAAFADTLRTFLN